jgi:hypothetical protein
MMDNTNLMILWMADGEKVSGESSSSIMGDDFIALINDGEKIHYNKHFVRSVHFFNNRAEVLDFILKDVSLPVVR